MIGIPSSDKGLRCPCGSLKWKLHWKRDHANGVKRSRKCVACGRKIKTIEVVMEEQA